MLWISGGEVELIILFSIFVRFINLGTLLRFWPLEICFAPGIPAIPLRFWSLGIPFTPRILREIFTRVLPRFCLSEILLQDKNLARIFQPTNLVEIATRILSRFLPRGFLLPAKNPARTATGISIPGGNPGIQNLGGILLVSH